MSLQRALGIMVLLSIVLLIVPNLHTIIDTAESLTTSVSEDYNSVDQQTTVTILPEVHETINTNSTIKPIAPKSTPLESELLTKASLRKLDINTAISINLPRIHNEKPAAFKKTQQKPKMPILSKSGKKPWFVKIASLKASNPFAVSGFKQLLKRNNIGYISYKHIINKTKWVRFNSVPVGSKKKAEQLRNYINHALKILKINAIVLRK